METARRSPRLSPAVAPLLERLKGNASFSVAGMGVLSLSLSSTAAESSQLRSPIFAQREKFWIPEVKFLSLFSSLQYLGDRFVPTHWHT